VESLKSLLLFEGTTTAVQVIFSAPPTDAFSVFASPVLAPLQLAARLHRAQCLGICLNEIAKTRGDINSHSSFNGGVFLNNVHDLAEDTIEPISIAVMNCYRGGRFSLLSEAIQALPDAYVHRLCIHGAHHVEALKETIDLLLQNGASLENLSGWGENCVGTAVLRGSASALRYLLELTGRKFIGRPLYMNVAKLMTTPLGIACWRGDADIFDTLIKFGAEVGESPPPFGPKDCCIARKNLAPLHVCSISRHQETVAFASTLLDCGAKVDPGDEFLPTPLYFALLEGELQLAQLLIDHGADMRARIYAEDGRSYKTLVGAVVSRLFSGTPFGIGCDPIKILEFLLRTRPNCNPTLFLELMDSDGSNIFHIAASASSTVVDEIDRRQLWSSLVSYIACAGDFFNKQNIRGETPLHVACANLDLAACETLLQAGCCTKAADAAGKTPYDVAEAAKCKDDADAELSSWTRSKIFRLLLRSN
jgi:ankyrin repeat protein